ncbi:hypothetical protein HDZ31DRAFT_48873 [Schizophyllum fasciatum]
MKLAIEEKLDESLLHTVKRFNKHVFPDDVFRNVDPKTFVDRLKEKHYDEDAARWTLWPINSKAPMVEQLAIFLNALGDAIRVTWLTFGVDISNFLDPEWQVGGPFHKLIEGHRPVQPTLVLWADVTWDKTWSNAIAIATMVNIDHPDDQHPMQSIVDAAGALLGHQPSRAHGLALAVSTLAGNPLSAKMQLVVFDRAGITTGLVIRIHDAASAESLVRLVAGLMFAPQRRQGWDPTIYQRNGREYVRIKDVDWAAVARTDAEAGVTGKDAAEYIDDDSHEDGAEFEVVECSAPVQTPDLHQTATTCWKLAGPDGRIYAMRDSWDEDGAPYGVAQERKMARKLGHVEGMTDIVASGVVAVDDVQHTTDVLRSCIGLDDRDWRRFVGMNKRTHHRVLMYPYSLDMASYKSPIEVLHMMCDIVLALKDMVRLKVMHCDISYNNVRMWRPRNTGTVRGILIDLDKACELNEHDESTGNYCGTAPFLSIGVLHYHVRTPADDLESVVYLIIYICTAYDGPHGHYRRDKRLDDCAIECWDRRDDSAHLDHKMALRSGDEAAIDAVLDDFTEYFAALKPVTRALLETMFKDGPLTHDMVFGLLDDTLQMLASGEELAYDMGETPARTEEHELPETVAKSEREVDDANKERGTSGKENKGRFPVECAEGRPVAQLKRQRQDTEEYIYGKAAEVITPKRPRVLQAV